ncbi:MAG: DNA photolyase family protein [Proteobacteria bacterium]|nr:DNA photolyase family protein [Pseudomonadota bacterium]
MTSSPRTLYLFRKDLRVRDNPALMEAAHSGQVLLAYILDDTTPGAFKLREASRCWLHHSLASLNTSLGGTLNLYKGEAPEVIGSLLERYPSITSIHWNRCYEPWRISQDKALKESLKSRGLTVTSHNASLLWEPWQILTKAGTPYQVFTPYYTKGCLSAPAPRAPMGCPSNPSSVKDTHALALEELCLLPARPWHKDLMSHWQVGEAAAYARLEDFCEARALVYAKDRDFPSLSATSLLSPHLAFGEISPNQIWWHVHGQITQSEHFSLGHDTFLKELAWREFSYYLLYHFPDLPVRAFQKKFDAFSWSHESPHLEAWQRGQTGYPLVDAGMRELWQTGTMHNRVRMVVASFLVKNLGIHWHEGAKWFWDCLVDADLASNSASWQWVAGCGADAAPYFRIFNPTTQGQKFDSDGTYTRRYVPELAALPDKYLFTPSLAPAHVLQQAGVRLGTNYPHPIVDLSASRQAALEAYGVLSKGLI